MRHTYRVHKAKKFFQEEFTFLNGYLRNVVRFPNRTAVIDPETERSWTYAQLDQDVNRFANALKNIHLKRGQIVMCAVRNCPEFIFSYLAPRKLGAILLAVNPNFSAGEMALLIRKNKPKIVIYSPNAKESIEAAQKMVKNRVKKWILADNVEKSIVPKGHVLYQDFTKDFNTDPPEANPKQNIYNEVLRLCTSGTTATPKIVPISDINEVLSAHDVLMNYPLNYQDRTMNMTPWFHRGGVHAGGPGPVLYAGASLVVMRKFMPRNTLDWVRKYSLTFLTGTPANLSMLVRTQEQEFTDLSTLKGIIAMGAPLTEKDCMTFMEKLTPNIFNGYGTTESFWNCFLRPFNLPEGCGSVGPSCTDDEVRVVHMLEGRFSNPQDTVPQDNHTEGEIIIKSLGKSTWTYIKNSKATRNKFHRDWIYTGDVGTWDSNGIITVRGRKDEMMVVSGENIYPQQIEQELETHPKVKDSIVTAIPDLVRGQSICAYIVPEDSSLTIQELVDHCRKSTMLPHFKQPRYYACIDSVPKTATGKKKHHVMKLKALADIRLGILKRD